MVVDGDGDAGFRQNFRRHEAGGSGADDFYM
jgi:hypothetical protein